MKISFHLESDIFKCKIYLVIYFMGNVLLKKLFIIVSKQLFIRISK